MRTSVVAVVMVMCGVMVHADVKPQRDFSLQRFAGRWYRVGLAYDSPKFIPLRDKVKASMGLITPLPNGNVNLTMWDATPVGCLRQVYQYEKTNTPGQFSYFSTRHNMVKDITVVDTNYTDYALVLKHKVFNREYTQVADCFNLCSVCLCVPFALSQGFTAASILTPPPLTCCCPCSSWGGGLR
uniref:Prostaglandin D2 synthase a n=1 Tax=Labrus bergylta TaxID=56723 RepID=A0A3Q3EHG6_9LABR